MHAIALFVSAIWGGVWWRFRGGALTKLTGFNPGTSGMRVIAASAMGAPLALFGSMWLLAIPALWLGWSISGWGAFQGMGNSPVEEKNPIAALLSKFLLIVPMCIVGMAIEGCMALAPVSFAINLITYPAPHWGISLVGILFSPIYLFWQRMPKLPNAGGFAKSATEWAEVTVGAVVQTALVAAALF